MQYSYSTNEERYHGDFPTPEAAADEGFAENEEADVIFVGENRIPMPEDCIDGNDVIESVQNHEDFLTEFAEDWHGVSKERREELTNAIRKTFGEWIDKHGLRPTFFTVDNVKEFRRPE